MPQNLINLRSIPLYGIIKTYRPELGPVTRLSMVGMHLDIFVQRQPQTLLRKSQIADVELCCELPTAATEDRDRRAPFFVPATCPRQVFANW